MDSPAQPTQAALLGATHPHSLPHARTLAALAEVTGIHLWDPEGQVPEAIRAAAGDKLVAVHDDLDTLLADDQIGWVLCSVRNDLSPEVLGACADAGKPVLSEKPLGRSLAEVRPVVERFNQRGLSLAVCFQNRYKPGAQQIRTWTRQGLFGRLCAAETRLHTTQVALRDPKHWLFDARLSGGGILPWLGCHYLDLLRYVMGAEVVSVTAHCATLSGEAIDVEDTAVLTLAFDNGVLATGTFGYVMPGGRAGYLSPGYDTHFGLKGTVGHVAWEITGRPQAIEAFSLHPLWTGAPRRKLAFDEEDSPAYGGRYGEAFARDCLHAAQTGGDAPATGDDMVAVWRIIEAAYRSQAEGVRVEV